MTRSNRLTKKKCFRGNRFVKVNNKAVESDSVNRPTDTDTNVNLGLGLEQNTSTECSLPSSSKKKIGDIPTQFECNSSGNVIVSIDILSQALLAFCSCKYCKNDHSLYIQEKDDERMGLACNLTIVCNFCKKSYSFWTSEKTGSFFDVNIKCVYGLKTIGKGSVSGKTLFGILDLPSPPQRFERYNKLLLKSLETVATMSMISATEEAVRLNTFQESDFTEKNRPILNPRHLSVGADGSWQRRGFSSLNGVVSVSSIDTGKILDIETITKYCHTCSTSKDASKQHACVKNHKGSSGAMEVTGALKIFSRSEATRNVKYKFYLGDGDSKGYQAVVDSKPYGDDFKIEKLECVGHVQKRMGGRLRRLRREMKGQKLSDGKRLGGGKGRLTDAVIDSLQNYYGEAIRRNKNDLNKMKRDVWATFFHKASTDENPQHNLCDESWCGYKQAAISNTEYKHKNKLDDAVIVAIKPTYQDLANPNLLQKCLHGRTQNVNESFNSVLWSRIPKTNFVGFQTLQCGALDAVITFNEGNRGRVAVLKNLGIKIGLNCLKILHETDSARVKKAEIANKPAQKRARQRSRMAKKKVLDAEKKQEENYGAGMF